MKTKYIVAWKEKTRGISRVGSFRAFTVETTARNFYNVLPANTIYKCLSRHFGCILEEKGRL